MRVWINRAPDGVFRDGRAPDARDIGPIVSTCRPRVTSPRLNRVPMLMVSAKGAAAFADAVRRANAAIDTFVRGVNALVLPMGMAAEFLTPEPPPRLNGVRVVHVRVTRTGKQTARWFGQARPARVRTCRGSRR